MYMPYLMFGYVGAILLMLAGCAVSARSVPGLRGIKLLSWGYAVGLVGVVLLALRNVAPDWATILLSNGCVFSFSVFYYCACAETLGTRKTFLPYALGLGTLGILADGFATYVKPDLTARILTGSGFCGLCAAVTAGLFFLYRESSDEHGTVPSLTFLTRSLGWLQLTVFAQHTLRCVLTFLNPPAQLIHMDLIQAAFSYSNMVLNVAAGCSLIWLALCVHRRELQMRAQTDGLTGLLNRRAFEDILNRELTRDHARTAPPAVMFVDIDHFKQVNDRRGHQAGDEVLRRVTRELREGLRPVDALARFGGEEFAILLHDVRLQEAGSVAERLREKIAKLTDLPGGAQVTVSIGVAACSDGESPNELLQRCDEALYGSKRGGRNQVTVNPTDLGRGGATASAH